MQNDYEKLWNWKTLLVLAITDIFKTNLLFFFFFSISSKVKLKIPHEIKYTTQSSKALPGRIEMYRWVAQAPKSRIYDT